MSVAVKCPNCEKENKVDLSNIYDDGALVEGAVDYQCANCGAEVTLLLTQEFIEPDIPRGPDPDLLYDQAREAKYRIDGR